MKKPRKTLKGFIEKCLEKFVKEGLDLDIIIFWKLFKWIRKGISEKCCEVISEKTSGKVSGRIFEELSKETPGVEISKKNKNKTHNPCNIFFFCVLIYEIFSSKLVHLRKLKQSFVKFLEESLVNGILEGFSIAKPETKI